MMKGFLCFVAFLAFAQSADYSRSARMGSMNRYFVYTPENKYSSQEIVPSASSIAGSNLDSGRITLIIVHGFEGSAFSTLNPLLREEFLEHQNVNVIVVDWSAYAGLNLNMASIAVPSIGIHVGQLINSLIGAGFQLSQIHLIGFNLGAHVCGYAGRQFNGQLGKITGLDPSGGLWASNIGRLSINDAQLVEGIHTNGNINGIDTPIGHIDFFMNGGRIQPGCTTPACHHNRAYEYMAATAGASLVGRKCETIQQARVNTCTGQVIEVGTHAVQKRGSGIYRANTGRSFPYLL